LGVLKKALLLLPPKPRGAVSVEDADQRRYAPRAWAARADCPRCLPAGGWQCLQARPRCRRHSCQRRRCECHGVLLRCCLCLKRRSRRRGLCPAAEAASVSWQSFSRCARGVGLPLLVDFSCADPSCVQFSIWLVSSMRKYASGAGKGRGVEVDGCQRSFAGQKKTPAYLSTPQQAVAENPCLG